MSKRLEVQKLIPLPFFLIFRECSNYKLSGQLETPVAANYFPRLTEPKVKFLIPEDVVVPSKGNSEVSADTGWYSIGRNVVQQGNTTFPSAL